MKRLKSALWWLKTWARTFKARPDDIEIDQLEATRAILSREIEAKAAFEDITGDITADGPLGFAAAFERQAAVELCDLVRTRAMEISNNFQVADSRGWEPEARAIFWELEDRFDPFTLDSAIGGLRSMAEAMRLEATR